MFTSPLPTKEFPIPFIEDPQSFNWIGALLEYVHEHVDLLMDEKIAIKRLVASRYLPEEADLTEYHQKYAGLLVIQMRASIALRLLNMISQLLTGPKNANSLNSCRY